MTLRFLLDTHILVRWLLEPKKLSREQARIVRDAMQRQEPIGISAMTLVEIGMLLSADSSRLKVSVEDLLESVDSNPIFHILPITMDVAREVPATVRLRDPADRAIVATALAHNLRLLTSDTRIIESRLVAVVD